ncbi:hypothetical protein XSR1_210031 [Xenorhabdus szentirmaii DSM 16338]|uniref:Uncharacterized protein n=1 Tax=Xenorhabdus szentirmaii DSM 16338 TaxID=1427518 RepID=W1IVX7_9GAMM|nr:hypothetical protein XSR1_210031 [Xenorhabdus szentirmaii DSM 16338]
MILDRFTSLPYPPTINHSIVQEEKNYESFFRPIIPTEIDQPLASDAECAHRKCFRAQFASRFCRTCTGNY